MLSVERRVRVPVKAVARAHACGKVGYRWEGGKGRSWEGRRLTRFRPKAVGTYAWVRMGNRR